MGYITHSRYATNLLVFFPFLQVRKLKSSIIPQSPLEGWDKYE